jgi:hypothetical protein
VGEISFVAELLGDSARRLSALHISRSLSLFKSGGEMAPPMLMFIFARSPPNRPTRLFIIVNIF